MVFSKKHFFLMLFCSYSLLSVFEYLLYSLSQGSYGWVGYICEIPATAINFLLAPILAAALLSFSTERKPSWLIKSGIFVSLSRVFYYLPYFYIRLFSMGLETLEALPLALAIALVAALLFFGYSYCLYLIATAAYKGALKKSGKKGVALSAALSEGRPFDFSKTGARMLFPITLINFIINLPYASAVSFFVSYLDSFRMIEVLAIILNVVIRMALMVLTQLIISKLAASLSDENN